LFDIFESDSDWDEKRKVWHLLLQYFDENRTLTEEEVEKDFNNLFR
jgi:phenylalanyl-tRNA synthetase beta subunit